MKLRYDPVAQHKPFFRLNADGDAENGKGDKPSEAASAAHGWTYTIIASITGVISVLLAVATIILIISMTGWETEFTNHFLVLTAHRTRDLQEPNAFSMNTVLGDDPSTRLYVCMMHAGITADCTVDVSPSTFRTCLIGKNKDCLGSADYNWPIDYGFQKCVATTLNPPPKNMNIFVECMRRSSIIEAEAVESQNTMNFIGSYNYASLLLTAASIMVSFLIFTAGGMYHGFALDTEKDYGYHIWSYAPLSGWNTLAALIWSLFSFGGSYIFMFPPALDAFQKRQGYPTTPWTGNLSCGAFFLLSLYYLYYVLEAFWARPAVKIVPAAGPSPEAAPVIPVPSVPNYPPSYPALPAPPGYPSNGYSGANPRAPMPYQMRPGEITNPGWAPGSSPVPQNPRGVPDGFYRGPPLLPNGKFEEVKSRFRSLGIRLFTNQASVPGQEISELAPQLIVVYATMLLFADPFFFVGMTSQQHSPLQESVIYIFTGILLARFALVVTYKFMGKAFFGDAENKNLTVSIQSTRQDSPKQFALRQIVGFLFLASLFLLFIPLYHYMNPLKFLQSLADVGSNGSMVAITNLIFNALAPELVRLVTLILMWNNFVTSDVAKFNFFFFVFAWEIVARAVFIYIGIVGIPPHLKDQSRLITSYLNVS